MTFRQDPFHGSCLIELEEELFFRYIIDKKLILTRKYVHLKPILSEKKIYVYILCLTK